MAALTETQIKKEVVVLPPLLFDHGAVIFNIFFFFFFTVWCFPDYTGAVVVLWDVRSELGS